MESFIGEWLAARQAWRLRRAQRVSSGFGGRGSGGVLRGSVIRLRCALGDRCFSERHGQHMGEMAGGRFQTATIGWWLACLRLGGLTDRYRISRSGFRGCWEQVVGWGDTLLAAPKAFGYPWFGGISLPGPRGRFREDFEAKFFGDNFK